MDNMDIINEMQALLDKYRDVEAEEPMAIKESIVKLQEKLFTLAGRLRVLIPLAEVLEEVFRVTPGLLDEKFDRREEVRKTIRRMTEQEHDPDKTYLLDIETHARYRVLCSFIDLIREAPECMK